MRLLIRLYTAEWC